MNVMKWSLAEYSTLKSDLQFPEFSKKSGPQRRQPVAWAIGDQLISGFEMPQETQAFSISSQDKQANVDFFFEFNPELSLVQLCFLLKSDEFSKLFDPSYFFSRWNKGQKENLIPVVPVILALPSGLLQWLHEKDVRPFDLAPFRAVTAETMNFIAESFLQTRSSKSEGVQILEYAVDLFLMKTSTEKILSCFSHSAAETLKQLKMLRHPQTAQRDQVAQEKLNIHWPSNVQARYQRRGDKTGFDLQMFVANSSDLKKTITHLEKVIEEWKSLSQNH